MYGIRDRMTDRLYTELDKAETILRNTKNCLQHGIERGMLNLSVSSAQKICEDIDKYFDIEEN